MIVTMPPSLPHTEQPRPARAELLCLAGAILLGAILRLAYPGRMAIEHFDEGVYASNFWFGADEGYEYPARHLYAPPLLPAAIEWTMIIASLCGIRPTGFIPMIPSLVAGLATIPSIWWVGRRWFGPSAGIVSAWLVAASDFHSSYSRAALTDVPVCLFILWGVYFTWQALQTGTRRDIILAALLTSLAWWTKYNGWLPLAVGLSGAAAWQVTLPRDERQLLQVAQRWLLVAGLAFILWSPVLIGLQKHGGYHAVAANHRQYVEGFAKWPRNTGQQLTHVASYDGPLRPLYESTAASYFMIKTGIWVPRRIGWLPTILLFCGTVMMCLACSYRRLKLPTRGANCAVLAWICGLTLATPCYHAYPRLMLPWMVAAWLGVGLMAQFAIDCQVISALRPGSTTRPWRPQWLELGIAGWLIASVLTVRTFHAWEDRGGLAKTVDWCSLHIKGETVTDGFPADEAIVYVYGLPAAVFRLKADGLALVAPVANFSFVDSSNPRPTYFLFPAHLQHDAEFHQEWEAKRNRFGQVWPKSYPYSDLVRFDGDNDSGIFQNGLCLVKLGD
jgi:dolichyl-phosphate-mannose-protein mannosyltransferase